MSALQGNTKSLVDRAVVPLEKRLKGRFFNCHMCGQCVLQKTALVCPMTCPKGLRNGPCGGTLNGKCEVHPERPCVWMRIHQRRSQKRFPLLLAPVDRRLVGTSSYVNLLTGRDKPTRQPRPYADTKRNAKFEPVSTTSQLEAVLKAGHFALTAEIQSPRTEKGLARVEREAGVLAPLFDGINATSMAGGEGSISSVTTCRIIVAHGGAAVQQVCGRDVTAASFCDELQAGWDAGVRNVLCLTGDWPKERAAGATDAWQTYFGMDSAQMIYSARKNKLRFYIGGAANPLSTPRKYVYKRLAQKVACGADFFQTQIVLDPTGFAQWLIGLQKAGVGDRVFVLPSVPVILTARALQVCKTLPGVFVPPVVQQRLLDGAEPDGSLALAGMTLAQEICLQLRQTPGVSGIHLMILGGEWTNLAAWLTELTEMLRTNPKETAAIDLRVQ